MRKQEWSFRNWRRVAASLRRGSLSVPMSERSQPTRTERQHSGYLILICLPTIGLWDASDRPAEVIHHLGWPENDDAPFQGGDGSSGRPKGARCEAGCGGGLQQAMKDRERFAYSHRHGGTGHQTLGHP